MKTLHSRALSTVDSMVLFWAASLGMAAFVEQKLGSEDDGGKLVA